MDIVRDILDRVAGEKGKTLEEIEREIRRDYGGEQVYIPKDGDRAMTEISMRNAAIRADRHKGESVQLLMRRYNISRRRIYEILR